MTESYTDSAIKGFKDFTEQELNANRKGQITSDQLARIKFIAVSDRKISKFVGWGMFIFFSVLYSLIYAFDPSFRKEVVGPYGLYILLILWGIPLIALVVSSSVGEKMTTDFLAVNSVSAAKGKPKKKHHFSDGMHGYTIEIDRITFPVFEDFYNIVDETSTYAFYYVPAGSYHLILSWERL